MFDPVTIHKQHAPMLPSPASASQSPVVHDPPQPTTALDRMKCLLRKILRVSVTDGRIFIGTFAGTDKPLNIILINAEEFRLGPEENPDGRFVGQVVIPWKLILKVEADTREPDSQHEMYV